jgi:hypothetical protein
MFFEFIPGEVAQPRVVLHLTRPIETQPIRGLPLDESVHEVSALNAPPRGHLVSFYLYLLRQDVVPNFLPGLAHVRSLNEDLKTKVIDLPCPSCTRSR